MVEFLYQRDCAVVSRLQNLRLFALAVTSGRKCNITDDSGSQLIDLSASRGQTSRSHPALVEAITRTAHNYADCSVLSSTRLPAVNLAEQHLARIGKLHCFLHDA